MKQKQTPLLSQTLIVVLLAVCILVVTACQDANQGVESPVASQSLDEASTWLFQENQSADGGFGIDFNTGERASNVPTTLDAILAISAAGYDADVVYCGAENSSVGYLKTNAEEAFQYAGTTGGANGKMILTLAATNQNARNFAGRDFVTLLQEQLELSGAFSGQNAFNQALAVLALTAVDEPIPDEAVGWLEDQQSADGSWNDGFGTDRNVDATAMAIMALIATGKDPAQSNVAAALEFLTDSQLASGGWEYGSGFGENANSTALAIQALSAADEDFFNRDGVWAKNGLSPMDALLAWQNTSGAFQADFGEGRFDDVIATLQAIPALTGEPYPLATPQDAAKKELDCQIQLQDTAKDS